jgi:hypothetical protein
MKIITDEMKDAMMIEMAQIYIKEYGLDPKLEKVLAKILDEATELMAHSAYRAMQAYQAESSKNHP